MMLKHLYTLLLQAAYLLQLSLYWPTQEIILHSCQSTVVFNCFSLRCSTCSP
ncbi:hypothetical protein LDENG_00106760 [Lucifuga dentata]|nr:hypothetical protein LDENG_00106760 [Lucifuga dentata]